MHFNSFDIELASLQIVGVTIILVNKIERSQISKAYESGEAL